MTSKIPVVIVGAGAVANSMHIPAWKKIREVEIIGIYDIDFNRAAEIAKFWNIPSTFSDYDEVMGSINEGIIDICTPPNTHASLSIKALKEGHHTILEKPMAMKIEECEQIFREYQKRKEELNLSIIHNFLFDHSILKLKSLIKEKQMNILNIDIRMLHTPDDEMISDRNHWVHSLPGGRFGEVLIHPIYILRNLIGDLNLRDIYAVKRGYHDWVKFDELVATFDSKEKYGNIHISFNSPRWTMPLSMKIYGEQSILYFNGTNLTFTQQEELLHGYLSKQKIPKMSIAIDALHLSSQILGSTLRNTFNKLTGRNKSGHENLFESFVDSISRKKEMPYSFEEAYEANRTFLETLRRLQDIS